MKEKNYTGLIPENEFGKEITAESSIILGDTDEAKHFYEVAKQRLLSVKKWHELAGTLSANFQLTDSKGEVVDRIVQKGDYFRIDIAGPGSKSGEGYDWVHVEDVKEVYSEKINSMAILVRPAANPQTTEENVAHFYSDNSTSTFIVTMENNKVTASIYDRNTEVNQETTDLVDKVRNSVIGSGAKMGFSKLQWKALTDALIKR